MSEEPMAHAAKPTGAHEIPSLKVLTSESGETAVQEGPWRNRVVARSLGAARQQSVDRGAACIRAAMEILRVEGESLTVQDVADRAGFSLRILYRHFSSKDDLLAAVLEESLSIRADQIRRDVRAIEDPVDRLTAFVENLVGTERTPYTVALVKHELSLLTVRPEEVARAHRPIAELAVELVSVTAKSHGAPHAPIEDAVALLLATTRSYNQSKLLGDMTGLGGSLPAAREVVAYCLRGMGLEPIDSPSDEQP